MSPDQNHDDLPDLDRRPSHLRRAGPAGRSGPGPWLAVAVLVALVVLGALAWRFYPRDPAPADASPVAVADAPPTAPQDVDAGERFPIEDVAVEPEQVAEPLPLLDDSDTAALDAIGALLGGDARTWVQAQFLIPRLVATIDNLPNASLTQQIYAGRPVAGTLAIAQSDERMWLDDRNRQRYDTAVGLFESVDARRAVSVYLRFYPLLQQAYRDLGVPGKQFNDRLVEVIDHLLLAPDADGPIALVPVPGQPRWAFADPRLESASVGHKAMLRLGPAHAARVKAKLREYRGLLAGERPQA
jgi:hypothetical protein